MNFELPWQSPSNFKSVRLFKVQDCMSEAKNKDYFFWEVILSSIEGFHGFVLFLTSKILTYFPTCSEDCSKGRKIGCLEVFVINR